MCKLWSKKKVVGMLNKKLGKVFCAVMNISVVENIFSVLLLVFELVVLDFERITRSQ